MIADLSADRLRSPSQVTGAYPSHRATLESLLRSRAATDPARPFLVFRGQSRSWQDFIVLCERTADGLRGRGVRHGDRVAIMASNHEAHVLLLFALARLGAIMVPINPRYGPQECGYIFRHAGVSAVVCNAQSYPIVRAAAEGMEIEPWYCQVDGDIEGLPNLSDMPGSAGGEDARAEGMPDDTCIIVYTSGTTGFPKGVMHSQRTVVLCGERQIARVWLQPDDRCMCVLPMFHVNALFYSVAGAAAAGCTLIVVEQFSATRFWPLVEETGTTQVNLLMAMTGILARRPRSEFVDRVRLRCVSGSPFTEETMKVFLEDFQVEKVIEGFGMSEIPGAFSNPYDGPHKLASMGLPGVHPDSALKWTEARIVDEQGSTQLAGMVGELQVRIPTLMQGYWNDPIQTAAAFVDGWFVTGDLVRRDADGFFFFVGRKKDIIRRRGENISGAEIDRIISEHPDVVEVAAVAVPAELGEDEIMAVVVKSSKSRITENDIATWCATRLAAYKIPRYVVFVDSLPHTPTHKVIKTELRSNATLREIAVDVRKNYK